MDLEICRGSVRGLQNSLRRMWVGVTGTRSVDLRPEASSKFLDRHAYCMHSGARCVCVCVCVCVCWWQRDRETQKLVCNAAEMRNRHGRRQHGTAV
jgi:hypothetical protein